MWSRHVARGVLFTEAGTYMHILHTRFYCRIGRVIWKWVLHCEKHFGVVFCRHLQTKPSLPSSEWLHLSTTFVTYSGFGFLKWRHSTCRHQNCVRHWIQKRCTCLSWVPPMLGLKNLNLDMLIESVAPVSSWRASIRTLLCHVRTHCGRFSNFGYE